MRFQEFDGGEHIDHGVDDGDDDDDEEDDDHDPDDQGHNDDDDNNDDGDVNDDDNYYYDDDVNKVDHYGKENMCLPARQKLATVKNFTERSFLSNI